MQQRHGLRSNVLAREKIGQVRAARLQGRNPAASAASAVGKNRTRSRRGGREGQEGRQKMPVEATP